MRGQPNAVIAIDVPLTIYVNIAYSRTPRTINSFITNSTIIGAKGARERGREEASDR